MNIRKYQKRDKEQLLDIDFNTGYLGKSMSEILYTKKDWTRNLNYYIYKEPESIFLAIKDKKIVGYVLGCVDESRHNPEFDYFIGLILSFLKFPFMNKKDRSYHLTLWKTLYRILAKKSGEFNLKHPKNAAHIHINVLPKFRGKGIGTKLLKEFIKYAKSKGINTIHADGFQTKINPNQNFWRENGFKIHSKIKSRFWEKYYPDETIFVICQKLDIS